MGEITRRSAVALGAALVAGAATLEGEAMEGRQEGEVLQVGVIGCGDLTHGKAWSEILASDGGKRYGMRPTRVWDRDLSAAKRLAEKVGAVVVARPEEAGQETAGVIVAEETPGAYLELARPMLRAGKRLFFNRPFAGSVADAQEIVRLAAAHGARVYSASALFHTRQAAPAREKLATLGGLRLFTVTGASSHLGFYLPHAVASMVSVLGTGVESVQALSLHRSPQDADNADAPVVAYVQYAAKSAVGPARGVVQMIGPGAEWYAFVVKMFGAKADADEVRLEVTYEHLLDEMAGFFRTGVEPIPHAVMLEKTAIYYAALRSAATGGKPVRLSDMGLAAPRKET
jgi:predicted dehydrogenase